MLLLAKINCVWVAVCAKPGAATSTTIASIAANNINFLNFFLLTMRGSHCRPILLTLLPEVDHLHQCQIICRYLPLETPSFLFTDSDPQLTWDPVEYTWYPVEWITKECPLHLFPQPPM